ncbi:MAG: Hsp33 family molecular chaperone HslO [Kiritimatiellae bacterium]|nr:Hsp33 family molecular chaperone HslO [Kiritimatiellia bacterium]
MRNEREEWYDEEQKVCITIADVTDAAQRLAAGHLCGPVSAHFLSEALAAAALLGAETSEEDETLILQMKCTGPIGGIVAECTSAGTLRGYTEKKVLEDFDGLGKPDPKKVLGERQIQVTRSVPGRIISQGLATTLGGYLTQSLQRNAEIRVEAAVSDEVEILEARGVMVEALPDSPLPKDAKLLRPLKGLDVSSRNLLKKLGYPNAKLKKTTPLSFACRCSAERAAAMLAALDGKERAELPETVDITCHMCGKTWSVKTR